MKDGFDPRAYKLMAKANYDFTAHTKFKSLKVHKQSELSLTQKKLLREGYIIPVSRKGLRYKSPEPIRITRKGKEKVVDSNHITIEEVDSMEEKEGSLKVKRHDVILTNPGKEGSKQEEGETSCHHITIIEELKIETPKEDMEDTPQSLEDGGQSIVDELKENTGTWSYKEMPGLDPKVEVYHLAIKLGCDFRKVSWLHCKASRDRDQPFYSSNMKLYIPQKAIKRQALADFMADHPILSDWKLCEDLPDDEVFFMEALIIGLQMALKIGVSFIEVYGDSKLIINKLSLQYDVKHEDLKPYFAYA
ncbi:uncharacterized protein E6C27_scaffold190G001550 [Cucumis melo var. makuwa]|uniref:RNase H type-1 domain-containing protein n=1 Tax=Cucumis melo var. makuwa TaxID=1194695 RepID=A0A5A7UEE4_CUCMM|nr:uncharacterized protein E6C27_scaffold190G001550 [Cucumis melo var. makuwa]